MEGLAPFLLFLFFMIVNIYTSQKRREQKKKQRQEFPDIYDNPPPRPKKEKNLDYMMAKPKIKDVNLNDRNVQIDLNKENVDKLANRTNEYEQILQNKYQEKLHQNKNISQAKDYIQQTEIKAIDKDKKIQIDIEKEHIMNAIMYAQVLEQPKSLQYLKRFGIKRIVHKD